MPNLASLGQYPLHGTGVLGNKDIEVIASAATISPKSQKVRVTGTTTIQTITPPNKYFSGPLYIFNTDASVDGLGTSGNIALAVTLTRYKVFTLLYDVATSKWYPSAAS